MDAALVLHKLGHFEAPGKAVSCNHGQACTVNPALRTIALRKLHDVCSRKHGAPQNRRGRSAGWKIQGGSHFRMHAATFAILRPQVVFLTKNVKLCAIFWEKTRVGNFVDLSHSRTTLRSGT